MNFVHSQSPKLKNDTKKRRKTKMLSDSNHYYCYSILVKAKEIQICMKNPKKNYTMERGTAENIINNRYLCSNVTFIEQRKEEKKREERRRNKKQISESESEF